MDDACFLWRWLLPMFAFSIWKVSSLLTAWIRTEKKFFPDVRFWLRSKPSVRSRAESCERVVRIYTFICSCIVRRKYRGLVDIKCGFVWHYMYVSVSVFLLMRMRIYICIYTCVCFCTFVYMVLIAGWGVGKRVGGTIFDSASSTDQTFYIYTSLNIMSLIVFYRYIM